MVRRPQAMPSVWRRSSPGHLTERGEQLVKPTTPILACVGFLVFWYREASGTPNLRHTECYTSATPCSAWC